MLKGLKIKYLIAVALLLCTTGLFAQDLRFTAAVSATQVGTGEPFEVSFSLNANGERFTPPSFEGFQVLSGPNESSSMTSINGRTSVSIAYSYDLVAVKEGEFSIGAAGIVANGRKIVTAPIRIKVVKGQAVQQRNQGQGGAGGQAAMESSTGDLSKSLFIKAVPDKTTVYQGQQVILTYKLYTRVGIVDSRLDKIPDLTGFWSEEVKNQQQQAQWRVETINGQKFNVADVRQTILFAEHSGDLKIDPYEMSFIARVAAPSNDIMDQFFGSSYQDVRYTAKSKPLVIHVKPLPENGKPAGFNGAVGKFVISAQTDKTELKANETLNYKVTVSGTGNIKLLNALNITLPAEFEKYDPKLTDTITTTEKGVSGSRIYNYLLIPRQQGEFTIDPLKFSFFNPATGKYVTIASSSFKIKVNKGLVEDNVTALSPAAKNDIQQIDKDIRYIKTEMDSHSDGFYGSLLYVLLLIAGPAACVGAFAYRNNNRAFNSDVVKVKSRRAGKVAARHLAHAEQQLGNQNEFYDAIFKGLYGYLSDKLNISMADLNRETIISTLKSRNITDQLIAELMDTLDLCEMARYAPVTQLSVPEVLEKAKKLINTIEDEIE